MSTSLTPCMINNIKIDDACLKSETELSTVPQRVILTITDVCNQRCRFCSGVFKKPSEGVFCDASAIEKMTWLRDVAHVMVVGAGEALCHPRYAEIIHTVRRLAPYADVRLYTNGLGLNGKRLEATVACCDSLEISQNAVSEEAYKYLIAQGNHKVAMRNLAELAKKRPSNMHVMLRLVVLKETIDEVTRMVDIAADYGFGEVIAMRSYYTKTAESWGLPRSSFSLDMQDALDGPSLVEYATKRGVRLYLSGGFAVEEIQKICRSPWEELRLNAIKGGFRALVCCQGRTNLCIANENLGDIHALWNHERLQFIRKTVNDPKLILANKMCMLCRAVWHVDASDIHTREKLRNKFRIPETGSFPEVWVGK